MSNYNKTKLPHYALRKCTNPPSVVPVKYEELVRGEKEVTGQNTNYPTVRVPPCPRVSSDKGVNWAEMKSDFLKIFLND